MANQQTQSQSNPEYGFNTDGKAGNTDFRQAQEADLTKPKPKRENSGQFKAGVNDPRAWKGGRPKDFSGLRNLAKQLAAEPKITALDEFLVVDGHIVSNVEYILRQMMEERDGRIKFLEIAFGKVPDQLDVNVNQITWKTFIANDTNLPERQDRESQRLLVDNPGKIIDAVGFEDVEVEETSSRTFHLVEDEDVEDADNS